MPLLTRGVLPFAALLAVGLLAQVGGDALRLHRDALVFDGHVHVINRQFYHGGAFTDRLPDGQWDLPRAREGGLDAFFLTLYVTEQYYPARYETRQALRLVDLALRQIEARADQVALARNATELEQIQRSGRVAAVLDLEGSFDLDGDLGVLRTLHRLGLRSMQLSAHNWAGNYADSCCSPPRWNGLNEQGRAVVREANRLGILINVSHASDAAIEQAVALSTDPVLATHHGLRSLNDIPRNLSDDLVRRIASKGGLIGFHMGNEFHNRKVFDWRTAHAGKPFWDVKDIGDAEARLSITEIDKRVAPMFPMLGVGAPEEIKFSVDEWLTVVDRVIALVGDNHIMLGTDLDGGPTLPKGMRDARDYPQLTAAMLRRNWSEARIRKFLGGNLLRVFRQVTES